MIYIKELLFLDRLIKLQYLNVVNNEIKIIYHFALKIILQCILFLKIQTNLWNRVKRLKKYAFQNYDKNIMVFLRLFLLISFLNNHIYDETEISNFE